MKSLKWLLTVMALVIVPLSQAEAGFSLSASLGYGLRVTPDTGTEAASLMVAPGYSLLDDILRLELGFVGSFQAATDGNLDELGIEFRPMLVIAPPVLPLYGRLTFAAIDLFEDERRIAYGGALGVAFDLAGLGVFGEAGVLPRSVENDFWWVIEGRAGLYYIF